MKRDKLKKSRLGKEGMTLIELMLVVVIIGILAAVIMPNLAGRTERANISACRASISAISLAVDNYEIDTGRYPPDLSALHKPDGSPNWHGPYVKQYPLVDPWGNEFTFTKNGDHTYVISSKGAGDGAEPITN